MHYPRPWSPERRRRLLIAVIAALASCAGLVAASYTARASTGADACGAAAHALSRPHTAPQGPASC